MFVVVFFFAGSDTSSTVISYAITELGKNLEVQEKLRQEIIDKIKSSNGEITYENLHEMPYLNQVMNGNLALLKLEWLLKVHSMIHRITSHVPASVFHYPQSS
jgi:hypothetical protein